MKIRKELKKVTVAAMFTLAVSSMAFAGNKEEGDKAAKKEVKKTIPTFTSEFPVYGPIDMGNGFSVDLTSLYFSGNSASKISDENKKDKKEKTAETRNPKKSIPTFTSEFTVYGPIDMGNGYTLDLTSLYFSNNNVSKIEK